LPTPVKSRIKGTFALAEQNKLSFLAQELSTSIQLTKRETIQGMIDISIILEILKDMRELALVSEDFDLASYFDHLAAKFASASSDKVQNIARDIIHSYAGMGSLGDVTLGTQGTLSQEQIARFDILKQNLYTECTRTITGDRNLTP
jgi:hypothetical protein